MEHIEIIKTPDEVNARIRELGAEIAQRCGSTPLTMIVVMNGGLFLPHRRFVTETHIDFPLTISGS